MDQVYNTAYYTVKRETSEYNKYMKWHVLFYREDRTLLSSQHFKTQKDAQYCITHAIWKGQQGFPIGNHLSFTKYQVL